MLQQIALGGLLIALPIYLQLDLGYNALQAGLSLAPLSLTIFGVALLAGRRAGRSARAASSGGVRLLVAGVLLLIAFVPRPTAVGTSCPRCCSPGWGWASWSPRSTTTRSLRSRRSGRGGLRRQLGGELVRTLVGLAFGGAILLAALSIAFTDKSEASPVLSPAEQEQVATVLEDDAQVMSDAQLEEPSRVSPRPRRRRSSASTTRPGPRPCSSRCSSRSSPP